MPNYDIKKPASAIALRFPQAQYNDLATLMFGQENVAKALATMYNTQWNLPYAKAASQTAQADKFDLVLDGQCAIVVLVYRSDLILTVLQNDGSAQAALVFCSPSEIRNLTPEYVSETFARYGITGECKLYEQEALKAVTSE